MNRPGARSISVRLNADEALGDRVLKVNHAGENGAVHIYSGQILIARITAPGLVPELIEFRRHEIHHRAIFQAELERRGVRRCRSYVLCGAGGWVLGALTAFCGRRAIGATTVAVEQVVLAHLVEQIAALRGQDDAAVAAISSIVEEEQQHHDSGIRLAAGKAWCAVLTPLVSASTRFVIWAGMHL